VKFLQSLRGLAWFWESSAAKPSPEHRGAPRRRQHLCRWVGPTFEAMKVALSISASHSHRTDCHRGSRLEWSSLPATPTQSRQDRFVWGGATPCLTSYKARDGALRLDVEQVLTCTPSATARAWTASKEGLAPPRSISAHVASSEAHLSANASWR